MTEESRHTQVGSSIFFLFLSVFAVFSVSECLEPLAKVSGESLGAAAMAARNFGNRSGSPGPVIEATCCSKVVNISRFRSAACASRRKNIAAEPRKRRIRVRSRKKSE